MRVLKVGLVLLLWVFALTAQAELKFPELTGRVVDNAQMIEPCGARAADPTAPGP